MIAIDYDCEFLEDGSTIALISIGMVCDDGREYYAVASDAPWHRIKKHDWLVRNVVPSLPLSNRVSLDDYIKHPQNSYPKPSFAIHLDLSDTRVKPHWVIANEVRDFIQATEGDVALWANWGAYDHVALTQLWGPMIRLPKGVPMFTHDLQQEIHRLGIDPAELPQQETGEHNALADARHNRTVRRWLAARGEAL